MKTIHERYSNRPQNEILDDMCLAVFATIYQSARKPQDIAIIDQISEEKIKGALS